MEMKINEVISSNTVFPIEKGGTGAATATEALVNLGFTATINELNTLDGITATTSEINCIGGVTSNIQTQLDGKSPVGHTHNYAGSDSAGGVATSAKQLETSHTIQTNLGSSTAVSFNGTSDINPGVTGVLPITNGGTGNATGKASSADKLATARTISLSGDVSGSVSFDGSADVSITAVVANSSHNHSASNISSGTLSIARGGTGNTAGYIRTGQKSDTTIGNKATIEGYQNTGSGTYSHVEGCTCEASGVSSHAEGDSTVASGDYSHAEGERSTASGDYSHAEGLDSYATADYAHAEGYTAEAYGKASHAEGFVCTAEGQGAHAEGYYSTAGNFGAHSGGKYNKTMTTGASSSSNTGDVFTLGNGTASNSRANCFRITYAGKAYGLSSFGSSGADYAEYFEWEDGNPNIEDRIGRFVTLKDNKIKIASFDSDYILGIVSGNPCIIGNNDEDYTHRYARDDFNRFIYQELNEEGLPTENTTVSIKEAYKFKYGFNFKVNPNYDPTKEYIERQFRQEWSPIGMMGVLSVYDDGTCEVNKYCKVGLNGAATKAEEGYIVGKTYRVLKRISDNIVQILFK